uniref:DNA-directed RNA polymerase, subunit N (RpoN/RPB10) n=1 Tax=uncultured marine group II/III euryarchaeote AD1000_88_G11 TaxID=1457822 RepID=A0A075G579_9EURY|nr:DNA-directed RNA polymerase, subunit N (RpoN/RPB10) [uncultured marine group II/III euryarchaeote AD1000_88_G11]
MKCFTCGKVLADKYLYFLREVNNKKGDRPEIVYLTKEETKKSVEGEVLDSLGLNKSCCRVHMLTHVDI